MSETRIPEALALLREKGWCKGSLVDYEGRHCTVGAVLTAHGVEVDTLDVYCPPPGFHVDERTIRAVVRAQHGPRGIAGFNDDPATTFADVESVLEKAILERGGAL